MFQYMVRVELLSDMIFGSGETIPGFLDCEVLYDEYGLPYFKGKTHKGKLREEFEHICNCLRKRILDRNEESSEKDWLARMTDKLFGREGHFTYQTLKFSDLEVSEELKQIIGAMVDDKENNIFKEDVLTSLTSVHYFTSINDKGVAEKGTLRKMRVINKGLTMYGSIYTPEELLPEEEAVLSAAIASLKHLGTMETRGKGHVSCGLLKNGEDITKKSVKRLSEVKV